jgi:hypothetical protein
MTGELEQIERPRWHAHQEWEGKRFQEHQRSDQIWGTDRREQTQKPTEGVSDQMRGCSAEFRHESDEVSHVFIYRLLSIG